MKYDIIEDAFLFVSGAPLCERSAVINRKTNEPEKRCWNSAVRKDFGGVTMSFDEALEYFVSDAPGCFCIDFLMMERSRI